MPQYNSRQNRFVETVKGFIDNTLGDGSSYWQWEWEKDASKFLLAASMGVVLQTWSIPTPLLNGGDFDFGTEVFFPQQYTLRVYNLGLSAIDINSVTIDNEVECNVTEIVSLPASIPAKSYAEQTISVDPIMLGEIFSFRITYDTNLPGSGEFQMAFHGTFFDAYQTETRLGISDPLDLLTLGDEEVIATLAGLIPASSRLIPTRVVIDTVSLSGTVSSPPVISVGNNIARDDIIPGVTVDGVNEVGDKIPVPIQGTIQPIVGNVDGTIGAKVASAAVVAGGTPAWTARVILYGFFLEDPTP